jgi:hypothetical protein
VQNDDVHAVEQVDAVFCGNGKVGIQATMVVPSSGPSHCR